MHPKFYLGSELNPYETTRFFQKLALLPQVEYSDHYTIAKNARIELEKKTSKKVVSPINFLEKKKVGTREKFIQELKEAHDQIEKGDYLTHEEMKARIEKRAS